MADHFDPAEKRDRKGKWTRVAPLFASDLSTSDARRSPLVSDAAFQTHAKRGAAKLALRQQNASPPMALEGPRFKRLTDDAYDATRAPWGGITADSHTGAHVAADTDAYALAIRKQGVDSIKIEPDATREEFDNAMSAARDKFAFELAFPGAHLGVFHDDDLKKIEFDPVLVTPSLDDVHDIGAYTRATGGAYHFKSGDGFWPPHVKETAMPKDKKSKALSLSFLSPTLHDADYDLAAENGRLAFWKQILPIKRVHYTAKDGSRQVMDFTADYLSGLASNTAVDALGFLLADKDNKHTMDPERWRAKVAALEVRTDVEKPGLYGKVVFPSRESAKAVLDNPDLGVSARIRPNVQRSDGTTIPAGLIHVLGTLDPQVSGMSPWQATDLSSSGDEFLDLSDEEYEEMPKSNEKAIADYTEADLDAMDDAALDAFLVAAGIDPSDYDVTDESEEDELEDEDDEAAKRALVGAGADMSKTGNADIDLARQEAADARADAREARSRVAAAEWRETRNAYLEAGVPPHALDLAAPVLNRAEDMVIDLSVVGEEDDLNVSDAVRGLLDALKGTVDLSAEEGHFGLSKADDNPDTEILDAWDIQG